MSLGVISSHAVIGGGVSPYAAAVLADSPALYLKLDEAASATVATDSSGNARDGAYSAGITSGAASLLSDNSGASAQFAFHTSTGIAVPTASWMNVAALSVEALVNFSSATDTTSGDAIVSRYGGAGFQWLLARNTTGKFLFQLQTSGSGFVNVNSTTSPVLGTRYDVAATWDGLVAKLFINGVQEGGSVAATGSLAASTEAIRVGCYSGSAATVPGAKIDEVSFYGAALSSGRLAAHFAAS